MKLSSNQQRVQTMARTEIPLALAPLKSVTRVQRDISVPSTSLSLRSRVSMEHSVLKDL